VWNPGFDDAIHTRCEPMLFDLRLQDPVDQGAFDDTDSTPDSRLCVVPMGESGWDRRLGEFFGSLVGLDIGRERLHGPVLQ
jgi:hypothetical protein